MAPDEFPPKEPWAEFVKMRKQIKKPMTAYAEKLMLKRLRALVDDGQDATAMLDQSILGCWQNVYAVKTEEPQHVAPVFRGRPQLIEVNRANSEEAIRLLDQANFDMLRTINATS